MANCFFYWANVRCRKWPNIEEPILPFGHTALPPWDLIRRIISQTIRPIEKNASHQKEIYFFLRRFVATS